MDGVFFSKVGHTFDANTTNWDINMNSNNVHEYEKLLNVRVKFKKCLWILKQCSQIPKTLSCSKNVLIFKTSMNSKNVKEFKKC